MAVQTAFDFAAPRRTTPSRARSGSRDDALAAHALAPADASAPAAAAMASCETLERQLGACLPWPVRVAFTDNTRTMLSCRQRQGLYWVRLHRMFRDAPLSIVHCIARYLRDGDRVASESISRYVDTRRDQIRARPRRTPVRVRGNHHDLDAIFAELNARYFNSEVDAWISWSRKGRPAGRRRKRRSIKLGSYRQRDALIRVHPVLDQVWVPRAFVAYVVYHEMLHHVLGIARHGGRHRMHTSEFRRRERAFDDYVEVTAWERANLDRLLSG